MDNFVHLHLHTQYSLLDGACRTDRLFEHLKKIGQTSVAITDHGVMFGVIDFYKRAKKEGIKPIIGCEVYVAPRTLYDKVHRIDSSPYHLVLLCKNMTGYQNLISMVSKASIEGFYTKPRVDMNLLSQKHEGLIALSGCLSGQVARLLLADRYEDAKSAAQAHITIFGKENYFIEIQNNGIESQQRILPLQRKLASELGIGLVATNDAHYIEKSDSKMQHILTCIQTNSTVGSSSLEFETDEFYIKTRAEMTRALPGFTDALDNTVKIAERCEIEFEFGNLKLPVFVAPNGEDNNSYFRNKCYEGLLNHYGDNPSDEFTKRLETELSVIEKMGFVDYFLIVADFIEFARKKGIPVGPGRGSGAGSIAAYCVGITGIDPMRYGLIFERFLNPERISMPDFDIDFCYVRRPEVIDYVVNRYGIDHVAQIITFGTMAARAAIRDTGRAMGLSYQEVDMVAKAIPMNIGITLNSALETSKEFRKIYDEDIKARDLIDTARALEGMPRHASTHAAGVVITREPVERYVPLQKGEDAIVTQYPMGTLEELGLLKMDFLGLRNLTVISDAQKSIHKIDENFNIENIPLDDKAVYEMLSKGKSEGVFQFESGGMKSVLTQLKPEYMEDLIAVISLYRPGPMDSIPTYIKNRHNPSLVRYKHPLLAPILDVTYGCIVYQEQVMQIFRELAGFSYGRADLVRRAMSKKKADVMNKERENFIEGSVVNGVPRDIAIEIFEEMLSFASYAFNKSHAAAYALISYQTAYLKCHYPKEYMAALLTSILDNTDKLVGYLSECEKMGISILPPNVNHSFESFSATEKGIHFGLVAIKNLGRSVCASIVLERAKKPFESFFDFCERMHSRDLRKRSLESLIKSGALDDFGDTRRALTEGCEMLLSNIDRTQKNNLAGQLNFFGEANNQQSERVTHREEYAQNIILKMEKEVLGLYVSGHPLDEFSELLNRLKTVKILELNSAQEYRTKTLYNNANVAIGATVIARRNILTKRGEQMAYITVEDKTGVIELLVFPKILTQFTKVLSMDLPLLISGKISYRAEESPQIILDFAKALSHYNNEINSIVEDSKNKLYLKVFSLQSNEWKKAEAVIKKNNGNTKLYIYFSENKNLTLAPNTLWVKPSEELLRDLSDVLGSENVVLKA